ncbi:MAG: hypothetical protein Q8R00_01865 [Candidatus Nanoarchaeia archaeon]|nr:hypothetical protein [Candidatus Nanoarchaeia archaeon]
MSEVLVSALLIASGLIYLVMPDWAIKFNIWQTKKLLGADFKPSKRTEFSYRVIGLILFLIGVYVMVRG